MINPGRGSTLRRLPAVDDDVHGTGRVARPECRVDRRLISQHRRCGVEDRAPRSLFPGQWPGVRHVDAAVHRDPLAPIHAASNERRVGSTVEGLPPADDPGLFACQPLDAVSDVVAVPHVHRMGRKSRKPRPSSDLGTKPPVVSAGWDQLVVTTGGKSSCWLCTWRATCGGGGGTLRLRCRPRRPGRRRNGRRTWPPCGPF